MKNINTILVIIVATLFGFTSCSKKNKSTPAPINYYMRANIGAAGFDKTSVSGYMRGDTGVIISDTVRNAHDSYIQLQLPKYQMVPGTFDIGATPGSQAFYCPANGTPLAAVYGSVTISYVGVDSIAGSFHFTCTDSTVVSSGTFLSTTWFLTL